MAWTDKQKRNQIARKRKDFSFKGVNERINQRGRDEQSQNIATYDLKKAKKAVKRVKGAHQQQVNIFERRGRNYGRLNVSNEKLKKYANSSSKSIQAKAAKEMQLRSRK